MLYVVIIRRATILTVTEHLDSLRLIYPKGYNHTSPAKFYTLSGINERIFTMEEKFIENIFCKFHNAFSKWQTFIGLSFLPKNMRQNFIKIIAGRLRMLE